MTGDKWRNSITRYGEEKPDQLMANPRNWRVHPRPQQLALEGAINDLGWLSPVIVNEVTGHVIDGHLRVELAISRGELAMPVAYVHLTEAQEAEALATFDPIGAMATVDRGKLEELLHDVQSGETSVQEMLAKFAADQGLTKFDQMQEWQGMPEFEQDAQEAAHTIKVHFATLADINDFAKLIDQTVTEETRFIWIPEGANLSPTMRVAHES